MMSKTRKKIALIICYIGKLPWYFDYFLHSCKYNLDVHFYILTDDKSYVKPIPENVFLIYKTLEDINKIATKKLGFKTNMNSGYKLCDFKPAYGFLFPELIKGYKFWGHGDLDVIYGKINTFITPNLLNEYDVISIRHDYLTGFFLLFRNNQKINTLFKQSKDYQKVFSSSEHFCFDETNFTQSIFTKGIHYSEIKTEIESMTHLVKKSHENEQIKAYFNFHVFEGVPGNLLWEQGVLTYGNKYEGLLYHLIDFKKNPGLKTNVKFKKIPDRFRISKTRIY